MDKIAARIVLEAFLKDMQRRSRDELLRWMHNPECRTVSDWDGTEYQIEFEAVWDSVDGGDLRVIASIDDGGFFRAMKPLSSSFLISAEGKLID